MSGKIDTFSDHIPEAIIRDNIPLQRLLKIIDGMQEKRKDVFYLYTRRFLYPLVWDIELLKRYVDEWNAEYPHGVNRITLDCLYRNYHEIYSRKGTALGLEALLRCLLWVKTEEPTVTITEYEVGKPLILFDDDRPYDVLPNADDIAEEVNVFVGDDTNPTIGRRWCPTLLDDTWEYQRIGLEITIDIDSTLTNEFLAFLKSVIGLYLPMMNPDFLDITVNTI